MPETDLFTGSSNLHEFSLDSLPEELYSNLEKRKRWKKYSSLTARQKSVWDTYIHRLPFKLKSSHLLVRPFKVFCRTCIITDDEIMSFVKSDMENFVADFGEKMLRSRGSSEKHRNSFFSGTRESLKQKEFFLLINTLIPALLKEKGYEIIRVEELPELKEVFIKKFARALHSRYLRELKNPERDSPKGDDPDRYPTEFENLPEEIRNSNYDNAAHVPTKLLAIGYRIREVKKGFKPFALKLSEMEIETMAKVEHLRWSWEKKLNGWKYGTIKNTKRKIHPSLVPYEKLSENEKNKDRDLVRVIPAFLKDIDYEAYPVSPDVLRKLSYAIKPQSSIHRILEETRKLNEQIKDLVKITPRIEAMVAERNMKIGEAIKEVEGSYNYAQHIQQTFLPDDLYIRECFPESFVLFKPRDLVSGDFYFFSRKKNKVFFAAVDCTGHGIPGALLSTLGYGILDQAVNEMKITDPSKILSHLYSRIHRYLRSGEEGSGLSDDMDIVLCIFDTDTNNLTWSGVNNPLFLITDGVIIEYPPQNHLDVNFDDRELIFTSSDIKLRSSDTLYLCSDGFSDQLGGKQHKRYQKSRLKNLLLAIHEEPMPEQSDRLNEEIEQWRDENEEDQTDDILVIGIKI